MKARRWIRGGALVVLLGSLGGCDPFERLPSPTRQRTSEPSTAPVFIAVSREVPLYQDLTKELDESARTCLQTRSCDRVHYLAALVALYDNRLVAAWHFQQVVDATQNSYLADAGRAWLRMLREDRMLDKPEMPEIKALEQLVHETINQELVLRRTRVEDDRQKATLRSMETTVRKLEEEKRALKEDVRVRDEQVDELTSQLDALKRIDQEMTQKTRPLVPATKPTPTPKKDALP